MTIIKLIICVAIYAFATVFVGFTGLFAVLGHEPVTGWPMYLSTVAEQFSVPRRAPFALMFVTFVFAVPKVLGALHWWLGRSRDEFRPGSMAGFAFLVVFCGYMTLTIGVVAMADAAPAFSVMENVNLKAGLMLLGLWSVLAVILTMPAAAVANRLSGRAATNARA